MTFSFSTSFRTAPETVADADVHTRQAETVLAEVTVEIMIGKLHVVCVDIRTAKAAAKPQINAPAATQAEVAAGGNAAFKIGARTVARTGGKAAVGGAAVVEIAGLAVDAYVEKVVDAARTQPETRLKAVSGYAPIGLAVTVGPVGIRGGSNGRPAPGKEELGGKVGSERGMGETGGSCPKGRKGWS